MAELAGNWADEQNAAIVADYFAMLADDIAGRPYSKAEHNRKLQEVIGRPRGSIEYKHQNISAVLKGLGEDWIPGYKPAFNFQASLVDAVVRWLDRHPDWLARVETGSSSSALREEAILWIGPPPTHSNAPPPDELEQMTAIARKYEVAERDARNRALGRAGEVMAAGEGIETVLSLRQVLPDMPMLAALSAAHLAAILFPDTLRRLYIICDNDPAGDGVRDTLIERANAAGIEAIVISPELGDFNEYRHVVFARLWRENISYYSGLSQKKYRHEPHFP